MNDRNRRNYNDKYEYHGGSRDFDDNFDYDGDSRDYGDNYEYDRSGDETIANSGKRRSPFFVFLLTLILILGAGTILICLRFVFSAGNADGIGSGLFRAENGNASGKDSGSMTMRRQERTVIRRMQGKVLPGTGAAPAPKAFPVVSAQTHREMMRLYPRPLPKTSSKLLPALIHLHPHRIRTASRLPLQGIFSLIPGTRLPLPSSSGAETLKTVLTKRR